MASLRGQKIVVSLGSFGNRKLSTYTVNRNPECAKSPDLLIYLFGYRLRQHLMCERCFGGGADHIRPVQKGVRENRIVLQKLLEVGWVVDLD